MFSSGSSSFSTNNPFKSRFAGDAFDSEDPVARGTGEFLKARSSSFAGGEANTASAGVSSDKAGSFGVSGDDPFGYPTSSSAADHPTVMKATTAADPETETEESTSSKPSGVLGSREQRWGQAQGEEWDARRGSDLEGERLDKKEIWSKIKKGGMSAEELDSWASDNNVKMTGKGQAFLDAKLGRTSSSSSSSGGETEGTSGGSEGGGVETGSGGNEGGVDDTEAANVNSSGNRFKYNANKGFTHQARDYGAISGSIANEAHDRAAAMRGDELLELRKQIDKQPLYWKARSDVQTGDYLGDIWNFDVGDFKMPKPMSPVEKPDIGGIADNYMDRIDSIKPQL